MTARHLRFTLPENRAKMAAVAAGLLSVFSIGAVADVARVSDAPRSQSSLAVMAMDRSEHGSRDARLLKPAPGAKQLKYDYQPQSTFYYCGPGATRIALSSRGYLPTQDVVAGRLGTTVDGTQSVDEVTRVLNQYGKVQYHSHRIGDKATRADREQLRRDVVQAITAGIPVVANIVDGATDVDGVGHAYPGGHYVTVVGYRDNGDVVKIADPAYVNGQASYWMHTSELANWAVTRGYSA